MWERVWVDVRTDVGKGMGGCETDVGKGMGGCGNAEVRNGRSRRPQSKPFVVSSAVWSISGSKEVLFRALVFRHTVVVAPAGSYTHSTPPRSPIPHRIRLM